MGIGEVWDLIIVGPMLNGLIVLYSGLFHNFGLTIIILTIIIRLALLPLTQRQLRSSKAMQELQPKMQELQKKFNKDRQRLSQETSKLYKEAGVNPIGCLGPLIVQLPIWIALYQSIIRGLATSPEALLDLSQHLYSWPLVNQMVPLDPHFLGLNLAENSGYVLAVLVGVSMWVQQKMTSSTTADAKQQSMSRMMLWMMPMMFAFITLSFPSGLAIYWVTMNIVGIVTQYFITGWGGLFTQAVTKEMPKRVKVMPEAMPKEALAPEQLPRQEKRVKYGRSRGKRKDRRRSYRTRPGATGAEARPGEGGGSQEG